MENKRRITQLIALLIAAPSMVIIPIVFEIYYLPFYFIVAISLLPIMVYRMIHNKEFEKRFYERWQNSRDKGFWFNVLKEGLRSLVIMTLVISLSQMFGSGRTPVDIVTLLSSKALLTVCLILLLFNFGIGIAAWYENEKKYKQIQNRE